jgi:hypothetical protein
LKQLLPLIAILSLIAGSCKKDDTPDTPVTKMNTWKLGSVTYTVNNYASNTTDDYQVFDKAGNGLNISFKELPVADGSYSVVPSSTTLGPNQIHVLAHGPASGSSYFATGNDHTVATVKVTTNAFRKVTISLPDTWVVKGADSMKLSVNIGEL